MTDWLRLAADICLSPYADVASLESLSSSAAGDTGVIGATVAPEFSFDDCVVCNALTEHCSHGKCLTCEGCGRCKPVSEFAPQGASQGVSRGVTEEYGGAIVTDNRQSQRETPQAERSVKSVGDEGETEITLLHVLPALSADSQGVTRGVDIRSSSAATEFNDCLYCNQRTVHCQAHARCLSCGEGCRECAVSGLSASRLTALSKDTKGAQCEMQIAARPCINNYGTGASPDESGKNSCGMALLAEKTSGYAPEGSAGILTFDEEYGRTYRGRLFTGNTIEELLGAVMRAEQGARR